jgi:hypothetical protein
VFWLGFVWSFCPIGALLSGCVIPG